MLLLPAATAPNAGALLALTSALAVNLLNVGSIAVFGRNDAQAGKITAAGRQPPVFHELETDDPARRSAADEHLELQWNGDERLRFRRHRPEYHGRRHEEASEPPRQQPLPGPDHVRLAP